LMSDFGGGALLLLFGGYLFHVMGFAFSGTYEYVVFAFMIGTGIVHWYGVHGDSERMGAASAAIRLLVSATFCALYMVGILDGIALLVAVYDGVFAMIYWPWLRGYQKEAVCIFSSLFSARSFCIIC